MKLLFRSVRSFIYQLSRKEGFSVMSPYLLIRLSGFVHLPQLLSPPTGIRHICRNEDEESSRIACEWNVMPRYRLRNSHWKLVILCKKNICYTFPLLTKYLLTLALDFPPPTTVEKIAGFCFLALTHLKSLQERKRQ
jgi:hypothetical protein